MMTLLFSSNSLHMVFTSSVYAMAVLTTCSTNECRLQLGEKSKGRSVILGDTDITMCHIDCAGDDFILAWCPQIRDSWQTVMPDSTSPENHHNLMKPSCGSKVCNTTSVCLEKGCSKTCVQAPPLCDLHIASMNGNLARVKFLLSQEQVDLNCQEWIGRSPVMWAATGGHREVFELLVKKGANVSLRDTFGIDILHGACIGGDVELVKYVLSQNSMDVDSRVKCMRTAIMLAAENRHKDVVELLVVKGADVSLVDKTGDNIFHCACRSGGVEVVKYILSRNMGDINSRGHHKWAPVMVAAVQGHKEVVELLVKHGADLSIREKSGNNALHLASYHGKFDVVKYLLSLHSVDINSRGSTKRTPVMEAADQGHKEVVELLVKHRADLSLSATSGNKALHFAVSQGQIDVVKYLLSLHSVDINSRGSTKRTPVMEAADQGHKEVVELLVKHGADLSLSAASGNKALHFACSQGQIDVVKYLLSLNSVDVNSRGRTKRTPVMEAADQGHKEVVELLVKHGADLSLSAASGNKALHFACSQGQIDVVKYLLSLNSVDVNSRGRTKRTPVMEAADQGHKEVVELLVKHGADLSLSATSGNKALHLACSQGQIDVVKYLLSLNSVDTNSRGRMKRTPVMEAADQGHKEVVELLVKQGADLSLSATSGNKALHLACSQGQIDVVKYLLSLNSVHINSRGWKEMTPAMVAAEKGYKEVVELLLKNGASL